MTVLKSDECFVSIEFFQAIDLKHSLRSFTSRHMYSDRIFTACAQSQRVAWHSDQVFDVSHNLITNTVVLNLNKTRG